MNTKIKEEFSKIKDFEGRKMHLDFYPFLRFASKSTYFLNKRVVARDCRILYILSGEGKIETDSGTFSLSPRTMVYYPGGCPYHIQSEKGMLFYTLNFDFSEKFNIYETLLPQPEEEFDYGKVLQSVQTIPIEIFQKTMCIERAVWAEELLSRICEEDLARKIGFKEIQNAYLKILLTELCRRKETESVQNALCLKIKEMVEENLALQIQEIAAELNYHPFYLNEVFKKNENCSLHKYIAKQRLIKANKLITTTQKTLEEIAETCGFSSHAHLTTSFQKEYHITPSSLRRQI